MKYYESYFSYFAKVDVVGPNPIARSNFIDENQVVTKSLI